LLIAGKTKLPSGPTHADSAARPTQGGLGNCDRFATDTEGGRAFFQERLRIWAKVGFFFTFGFFILDELGVVLGVEATPPAVLRYLHVAVVVLWGGAGRALRRWTVPRTFLGAIDASIVLVGCPLSVLDAVLKDPINYYASLPTLIVFLGSVGRAVFVPSTALRTLLVSLGIAVPVLGVAAASDPGTDLAGALPSEVLSFWTLAWSACAVVLAAVASRVIYGLRQQIRQALQLGQYTQEEKLGEGGMGAVYRARHAMLRRPTAVKLLPLEKAGKGSLERFER
jgi:serine/threonine-protein kinase